MPPEILGNGGPVEVSAIYGGPQDHRCLLLMRQQLYAGTTNVRSILPKSRSGRVARLALLSSLTVFAQTALARLRLDWIASTLARQFAITPVTLT
jgi:hypothetical protein